MYKTLYVIGNGFDKFHELETGYDDFKSWLVVEDVDLYKILCSIYSEDAKWWNNLERNMGIMDVGRFVDENYKYIPNEHEYIPGLPPTLHSDYCARIYDKALQMLILRFEEWIKIVQQKQVVAMPELFNDTNRDESVCLTFNYTSLLENAYGFDKKQVKHIHGCVESGEPLILGHDRPYHSQEYAYTNVFGNQLSAFSEISEMLQAVGRYSKRHYENFLNVKPFDELWTSIKSVIVMGFSFSEIDSPYISYIKNHIHKDAEWKISWFSEDDKIRAERVMLKFSIKSYSFFRLNQFCESEN